MKCTSKCTNQVYELAPPTCVLKILIDPLTFSYLSPYVKVLPLCHLTLSLCNFSPFVINDHKGPILDRLRFINVNQWGEDQFSKIGPIQNTCQRYLTRFDPRTSFFTPHFKGYLVPCCVKHLQLIFQIKHQVHKPTNMSYANTRSNQAQKQQRTIQASNLFDFHE